MHPVLSRAKEVLIEVPRHGKLAYCLLRDPRVPAVPKAALLAAIGLIVSPIDFPAWVPVLGELDMLALGVLLRLRAYFHNRALWLDEVYLALNLVPRSYAELLQPLDHDQGAPLGFLLATGATSAQTGTFERDVLPIFTANCLSCHGGTSIYTQAGLDLRTINSVLRAESTCHWLTTAAGQPATNSAQDIPIMPSPAATRPRAV